MYDLDLFDTPTDAISQLHNQGRKVVWLLKRRELGELATRCKPVPKRSIGQ